MSDRKQDARSAGILLCCAWLSACATTPPLSEATQLLPQVVELDSVPFHPQQEYQCGPAALGMVLHASGVDVPIDDLVDQVYLPARQGSLQPEMLATPRRHDRISHRIDGSLDTLFAELAAGNPVVVLQNLALPIWPMWHYAVVIGYDRPDGVLVMHTGTDRARRVSIGRFHNTWKRSGHWSMVVTVPGELPATVDRFQAVEATTTFERIAGTGESSHAAWTAVVEKWPDYALGWFGFGNDAYARGEARAALKAFRRATALDPDFGAAWMNLGFLHEETGDLEAAFKALSNAADIEGPWRHTAEQARDRLRDSGIRP